ncbi:hypothetical protein [Hathewaya massiliensis]|uniref:YobI family P-loop NTPase n=1 Tax=Hathewaya massiliensis TaxID=1964382 RepID=UPI0011581470|nr:hypothetical protein [Hathewaya massiliensis]
MGLRKLLYNTKFKNFAHKKLVSLIQKVNIMDYKLIKDTKINDDEKQHTYNYEDLTPRVECDKNKSYCETLQWALQNNNIKNIALTGVYGSGKSSILRTFEALHKEYKYLNISLADFKNDVKDNSQENGDECIEKQILQQIFYKVKYKDIPYSRFKRINNIKTFPILIRVFIISITIVITAIFLNPNLINTVSNKILFVSQKLKISKIYVCGLLLFSVVFYICLLTMLVKYLAKSLDISKFKVKIKNTEAEFQESQESVFNKYIDEIIYFFEVTKHNVVIFEDLDRFNNLEIFSKLRQLNLLIEQIS